MRKRIISVLLCISIISGLFISVLAAEPDATPSDAVSSGNSVTYIVDGTQIDYTYDSENIALEEKWNNYLTADSRAVIGWKSSTGKEYYYGNKYDDKYSSVLLNENCESVEMSPILCPVSLNRNEVFSFRNTKDIFQKDGSGRYISFLKKIRMIAQWFTVMGYNPLYFSSSFYYIVSIFRNIRNDWNGACFGFCLAEMLAMNGKFNPSDYQDAEYISDIEADEKVISMLNYYHIVQFADSQIERNSGKKGSDSYRSLLKETFETVKSGKPVIFGLYTDEYAHAVVFTGCYTHPDGSHVFLGYDPNNTDYSDGNACVFVANSDYSLIKYHSKDVENFKIYDEFTHFESFTYDGIYDPFKWQKYYNETKNR